MNENLVGGDDAEPDNLISGNTTGIQSTAAGRTSSRATSSERPPGSSPVSNVRGISLTNTTGFVIGGANPARAT